MQADRLRFGGSSVTLCSGVEWVAYGGSQRLMLKDKVWAAESVVDTRLAQ